MRFSDRLRPSTVVGVVGLTLFLDYFQYGMAVPLAPLAPGSPDRQQLGVLYGMYAVSVLAVTPVFGAFGDRIGSRRTLLCGVILGAFSSLCFTIGSSMFVLSAAKLCQGAASAASWTAGLALIAEHYRTNRAEIIGYAYTGSTAGSLLGPLLGGVLHSAFGYSLPFVTAGCLYILAAGVLWLTPDSGKRSASPVDWPALLLNPSVWLQAGFVALAAFAWGIIEPLLPYHLESLGAGVQTVAVLFTVSSAIFGMSAPWVGRLAEYYSGQTVIVIGILAMAAVLPLMAISEHIIWIGFTLCVVNVLYAFILNPASAELGNTVDRAGMRCYTAVYAVYNISYSVGTLGTAALATTCAGIMSFGNMLTSVSTVLGLCGVTVALALSRQRPFAKNAGD